MGLSYILVSIAGAMTTGALVASTVQHSISSEIPAASLAMILAVAGATTTMSADLARETCSILNSEAKSNISVTTGLPVSALKVIADTNWTASLVIITFTLAPA